jgi:GrpB-like predicted nucleotidyltransferase (UPF0157 family)
MLGIHITAVAWQRASAGDWTAYAATVSRRSDQKERTSPMNAPVEIADYDPGWPAAFAALRDRLTAALGPLAQRTEHVGSTAVPGLPAKPVIDLDVVIATRADLPEVIARLAALGYRHEGDLGITGREAFASPAAAPAHHLYVCTADSRELASHLAFRDYLRTHPEQARAYADLKRSLAAQFRSDRDAYSRSKAPFVEQALKAAAHPRTGTDSTGG